MTISTPFQNTSKIYGLQLYVDTISTWAPCLNLEIMAKDKIDGT
jgi:hypothetical protein